MILALTKEQADLIIGSLSYANGGKPNMSGGKYYNQSQEIIQLINKEKEHAE
jgi:hypothetical protein